jgi:hypothetical protein
MLNPWLAITFQTIRLGFEAQNAMALRMMRLVGGVSKTAAGGMIADKAPRRQMLKRLRKRLRHVLAEGARPSPKSTKNECALRGPGTNNTWARHYAQPRFERLHRWRHRRLPTANWHLGIRLRGRRRSIDQKRTSLR